MPFFPSRVRRFAVVASLAVGFAATSVHAGNVDPGLDIEWWINGNYAGQLLPSGTYNPGTGWWNYTGFASDLATGVTLNYNLNGDPDPLISGNLTVENPFLPVVDIKLVVTLQDMMTLALPGNPVAAFVCFLLYVRPVFSVLSGAGWIEPPRFAVPAGFDIEKKKPDRREFLRGTLHRENGQLEVRKFARDGSGLITSLRQADGLIELDEATTTVKRGDRVAFIPFSALGLTMS